MVVFDVVETVVGLGGSNVLTSVVVAALDVE